MEQETDIPPDPEVGGAPGPDPADDAPFFSPSKRFLRGVVEVTPALLYVFDLAQGRNVYVNRQISATLGYSPAEVQALGPNLLATLMHPDDLPAVRAVFEGASRLPDVAVAQTEYRMRHRDGTWRWFQSRDAVFRRAADGTALQIVGAALDITDRKRAEDSLRRSRDRLELATVAGQIGIWEWHAAAPERITWSEQQERLYGLEPGTFGGTAEAFYELVHPDDRARTRRVAAQAMASGRDGYYDEFRIVRRSDGAVRWIHARARFQMSTQTGEVARIVGVNVDITERREAEQATRLSEERYRLLTLATNQVVWWTDADGAIVRPAPLWEEFTGQGEAQYRGWGWLAAVHPDDRTHVTRTWRAALAERAVYECEYRLRRRDGVWRYTVARGAPILDAEGNVVEWVGSNADITERKALEAERETLLAKQTRVAETLQRSLLARCDPVAFAGLRVEMRYEPAWDEAKVGGDFYDTFSVAGGRAALVIGDVTGKGLEAASYTAEIKYALRTLLREHGGNPSLALSYLNRLLAEGRDEQHLMGALAALSVAVVDPRTGVVRVSSAGMEPPLLLRCDSGGRAGGTEEVAAYGPLLGMDNDLEYSTAEAELGPGDVLLLVTDGITEARAGGWRFFGAAGAADAARAALCGGHSLLEAVESVLLHARAFSGGSLRDDACVLAVRREIL